MNKYKIVSLLLGTLYFAINLVRTAERPGMAYEFSKEGFDTITKETIIPWMFS